MEVTDRAMEKLEELRDQSNPQPGQGVSLVITENNSLGLTLAHPQETDEVVERNGDPVVIIPENLSETLDGLVLDYVNEPGQEGFTLEQQEEEGGAPA